MVGVVVVRVRVGAGLAARVFGFALGGARVTVRFGLVGFGLAVGWVVGVVAVFVVTVFRLFFFFFRRRFGIFFFVVAGCARWAFELF